jgi:hypothetical protein
MMDDVTNDENFGDILMVWDTFRCLSDIVNDVLMRKDDD